MSTRLSQVRVDAVFAAQSFTPDWEIVREYHLEYEPSLTTGKSRLISVTEVSPLGMSLPAITFSYQDQVNALGQLEFEVDVNSTWGPLLNDTGDTSSDWSSLVGQEAGPWSDGYATGLLAGSYTFVDLMDVDGDSLPDRIMRKHEAPYTPLQVQYNNGHGFEPTLKSIPIWSPNPGNKMWGGVNGRGYDQDGNPSRTSC
jgi:hypothetical protein